MRLAAVADRVEYESAHNRYGSHGSSNALHRVVRPLQSHRKANVVRTTKRNAKATPRDATSWHHVTRQLAKTPSPNRPAARGKGAGGWPAANQISTCPTADMHPAFGLYTLILRDCFPLSLFKIG